MEKLKEVGDELLHLFRASPQLVAQAHHHERRVTGVFCQHVDALLVEKVHQHRVLVIEIAPQRQLGLQVEAQAVGRVEGLFGRAPRVESDVVDTIRLQFLHVVDPRLPVHGHVARERPHAGVVLAPKKHGLAVGHEAASLGAEALEYGRNLRRQVGFQHGVAVHVGDEHAADDAVPVGLGVLGHGVTAGIHLGRLPVGVVHDDGQAVPSGLGEGQ